MKLSIIGTGYVGLVTGVCLAQKGHRVVCVDVGPSKVDRINAGATCFARRRTPPLLVDGRRQIDRRRVKRYAGIGL